MSQPDPNKSIEDTYLDERLAEIRLFCERSKAELVRAATNIPLPSPTPSPTSSSSSHQFEKVMAEEDNVEHMGDLDIPTIPASPSSIALPPAARNYELKSSHFNMLPSFHGLPSEDPLTHLKDIFNAVSFLPLTGVNENQLKMRVFPYTLKDKAKFWLNSLKPGSLRTWDEIEKKFLEKFFSSQKTDMLRDKIMQFSQQDESFSEAWERFNTLLLQCPHHGLPLNLLMRIFYKGLTLASRNAVINFSGGSIRNKTAQEASDLYEEMARETMHSDTRGKCAGVNEVNTSNNLASNAQIARLERKMDVILALNQKAPSLEVCAICATPGHETISCPHGADFPEFVQEQANMLNSYNQRPRNDPFSPTYNPGWRNHPNFRWSNNQNQQQPQGSFPQHQAHQGYQQQQPQKKSLEDLIASMAQSTQSFIQKSETHMQKTDRAIANLEQQMGQLATALNQREPGRLPGQVIINPKNNEQVNAITLRGGKIVGKEEKEVVEEGVESEDAPEIIAEPVKGTLDSSVPSSGNHVVVPKGFPLLIGRAHV